MMANKAVITWQRDALHWRDDATAEVPGKKVTARVSFSEVDRYLWSVSLNGRSLDHGDVSTHEEAKRNAEIAMREALAE
jgi:hypothetical protein